MGTENGRKIPRISNMREILQFFHTEDGIPFGPGDKECFNLYNANRQRNYQNRNLPHLMKCATKQPIL